MSEAGQGCEVVHRGGGGVCVGASGICGERRRRVNLLDASGGTEITPVCEDIPPGIRPEDIEAEGNRSSSWLCCPSEVQISEKPGKTAAREARW